MPRTNLPANNPNPILRGSNRIYTSLADSSLSFLYSVKLDAAVLSLERTATEQLEAQTAALEVADSVLDVRHAFFEVRRAESAVGCSVRGRHGCAGQM